MAIKLSGPLSFDSDIVREFISDNATPEDFRPHSLSEYYKLGEYVPEAAENSNIPLDSSVNPFGLEEIKFSDFYGAVNSLSITIVNNQYTINGVTYNANMNTTLNLYNVASLVTAPVNNTISVPITFNINYGSIFNNSIITGGQFSDLTINNTGIICGRGGHGKGFGDGNVSKSSIGGANKYTGNPAIYIDSNIGKLSVINNSGGGFIAGGGNSTTGATGADPVGSADNSVSRVLTYPFNGNVIRRARATWFWTNGNGGGWNGGVGSGRRAGATAYWVRYEIDGFTIHSDDGPYNQGDPQTFSMADQRIVTSRSINGTQGHNGAVGYSGRVEAKGGSGYTPGSTSAPSASAPSGGIELNGGARGNGGGPDYAFASTDYMGVAVETRAASGSGGGNGIGSSSEPTNVNSSGRGTSAGAAYSLLVAGGATVTTGSFVNGGRRYGTSSITVSAP